MSPFVILLTLGAGALYLYGQSASAQAQAWPPSSSVQNGLVTQASAYYQQVTGSAPTPAMTTEIQAAINGAPAQYQASLPQGTAPTVAGYQQWVLSKAQAAMAVKHASAAGPLGLPGHDPYPMWDVHGNALFRMGDGSVAAVYHSNDQRGDFPSPRVRDFAVDLRMRGRRR